MNGLRTRQLKLCGLRVLFVCQQPTRWGQSQLGLFYRRANDSRGRGYVKLLRYKSSASIFVSRVYKLASLTNAKTILSQGLSRGDKNALFISPLIMKGAKRGPRFFHASLAALCAQKIFLSLLAHPQLQRYQRG